MKRTRGTTLLTAACKEHGRTIEEQKVLLQEKDAEIKRLKSALRKAIEALEPAVRDIETVHKILEAETADEPLEVDAHNACAKKGKFS
jgi:hypothetical protein